MTLYSIAQKPRFKPPFRLLYVTQINCNFIILCCCTRPSLAGLKLIVENYQGKHHKLSYWIHFSVNMSFMTHIYKTYAPLTVPSNATFLFCSTFAILVRILCQRRPFYGNGTNTETYVTGKYPVLPFIVPSYQLSSILVFRLMVSPSLKLSSPGLSASKSYSA